MILTIVLTAIFTLGPLLTIAFCTAAARGDRNAAHAQHELDVRE